MEDFKSLNLPAALMASLEKMKFDKPTPIQAQAIPVALEGKDILGSAQTGTGKTGAFGIPLITKLLGSPRGSALILTPTRELATQVMDALKEMLGKYSTIQTALLIGGESMPKQFAMLKNRPRLLVGTPGRVNDHLERGTLMLHDTNFLVLDETDRMLDMGFEVQIERIVKFLPKQRQTLLFSATLPDNIMKMANKYQTNPVRVAAGAVSTAVPKIKQEVVHTTEAAKYDQFIEELNKREGSIIVFVKTKWGAEKMAIKLSRSKYSADALHGDLRQNKRDRVIGDFRNMKFRILVATDIAARGLDIPHIEHVINYDLPQCPEDFIHRIGRTARAGAEGSTICFVTPADTIKWKAIQRLMNPGAKPDHTPHPHAGEERPRGGRPQGNNNRRRRFGSSGGKGGQGGQGGQRSGGENRSSRPQGSSQPRRQAKA